MSVSWKAENRLILSKISFVKLSFRFRVAVIFLGC
nr:MAG TPA: hypothetical protein [Bacteriophage sp.]